MAFHDDKHVITCDAVVIWDGLTKPDPIESEPGKFSFNLRVAVLPGQPEIAELEKLVQQALAEHKDFKGVMPHGGNHPISPVDPAKFPELPGHLAFSASTRLGAPPVFNMQGAQLEPMQYGPMIYNGTVVRLLVHAYGYNNKQKGVNFGLDGVQIVNANAPRLSIGAAGLSQSQVASAFGGSAAPAMAPAAAPAAAPAVAAAPYNGYAQAPAVPGIPSVPAPVWPPEGWEVHPKDASFFYCGQEVLHETQLRAKFGL
ncbi:hypothetical protein D3C78_412280 [compost metagenome]